MYTPVYTKQFAKDLKRCQRRGKNLEKFKILVRAFDGGYTALAYLFAPSFDIGVPH